MSRFSHDRLRILLTIALALSCGSTALRAGVRNVTFRTDDGVTLAGSFFEPSRRPAPAIVLVHAQTRARDDWRQAASRLSDAGFAVLTFDLRGHGGSGGSADAAVPMLGDLRAARAFLASRSDVQPGVLGMAGASTGANLVVLMAADEPAVRSIALISPGLEYRGLRVEAAMKKYGSRPALLMAGSNDTYAVRSSRQLSTLGGGERDLRLPATMGHGTVLLARAPDLVAALVDWFRRTLL
jgi:alpha-beta hydrolase superfamily lysophospholipase